MMPNDPNGDLQIKPATPAGGQNSASNPQPAAPVNVNPGAAAGTPMAQDQGTAPAQGTQGTQPVQPAQPANRRAFNLEADVEASGTGRAVPEKFAIPKLVRDKYPDLIELIKATESMDDQERQYWFQIIPVMTVEQIAKFKNILVTEKQQLAELDKEYEEELNRLNEKHLLEWKEFESKEKAKAIQEAEAKSNEEEQKTEEELLAKLSDV
jgi:hypothetical protein